MNKRARYTSFELRCILSFSMAWEGEQLADMSTTDPTLPHTHMSLLIIINTSPSRGARRASEGGSCSGKSELRSLRPGLILL